MAILKYFKTDKRHSDLLLPDPCGPLNQQLCVTAIEEANKEVTEVLCDTSKRKTYLKVSPAQKAIIARYAANHRIVNTNRQFSKDFPGGSLKESTICGRKKDYLKKLYAWKKGGKDMMIEKLLEKKTGRPLLLGESLDKEVQAYIQDTHKFGGLVNARIAIACATRILQKKKQ